MKSPKDMRIIQIDVTNACIHRCSNCTRFCGHHKKPFFMDLPTFKRAVDSLEGYVGTIGIMGGEPTLNPDFERMAEYLATKKPPKKEDALLRPQEHFMDEIHDTELSHTFMHPCGDDLRRTVDGPGLWSAIGEGYKKYYETIQDNIQYQALNDHSNVMYHQPALISRHDLKIPDDEWIRLRDNCWIQNLWSACITPKGAFFCEIAGALDMLFDGPGGWKIEPGWWKRTPDEFGDQLHWCEICGLACDTFMRNANEETDDVSPTLYKKLEEIGSPGLKAGRVNRLTITDGVIDESCKAPMKKRGGDMPYTDTYSTRFDEEKSNLYYKEIEIVRLEDIGDETFGHMLYRLLHDRDYNRYLMILKGEIRAIQATDRLKELVLNPGVLLYRSFDMDEADAFFEAKRGAEVMLVNGCAHSVRDAGWDVLLRLNSMRELYELWQPRKRFVFEPGMEKIVPTVMIEKGLRYVIYGGGYKTPTVMDALRESGASVTAIVDPSEKLIGTQIGEFTVQDPEKISEMSGEYDKVLICIGPYYTAAKERLLGMGIPVTNLAWA